MLILKTRANIIIVRSGSYHSSTDNDVDDENEDDDVGAYHRFLVYVFYVCISKLHCDATPPAVISLFPFKCRVHSHSPQLARVTRRRSSAAPAMIVTGNLDKMTATCVVCSQQATSYL